MRGARAKFESTSPARRERKSLSRKLVRIGDTPMSRGVVGPQQGRKQDWTFVIF
jgi:hypothetical protein